MVQAGPDTKLGIKLKKEIDSCKYFRAAFDCSKLATEVRQE
jgi:hypothetical protein